MRFSFWLKAALGIFWAVFVVGCAGISGAPETPEQAVKARAQERWDALKAGQYEKAYSYLTPSMRLTLPLEVFRGRLAGVSWIDVKVMKVVCEPEICDVTVKMDHYVLPNLRDSQPIEEKWILEAGNWWFVYRG